MSARSTKLYNTTHITQQQLDDILLQVVNKMGSLSKKLDVMWTLVFDKPESSTNPKQDDGGPKIPHEGDFNSDDHSQMPPPPHFTPFKIHEGCIKHMQEKIVSNLALRHLKID